MTVPDLKKDRNDKKEDATMRPILDRMHRDQRGVTLVETIITLLIFAIISLMAYPFTGSWQIERRTDSMSHLVAADMAEARMIAIMRNVDVAVTFDPGFSSYEMRMVRTGLSEQYKLVGLGFYDELVRFGSNAVEGVNKETITGPITNGDDDPLPSMIFHPNGSVTNPGTIYLIPTVDQTTRSDRQRAVTITRNGRITRWHYEQYDVTGPWKELI
jgi:prepilin-type N-terminal cleavage/methylation domain-containing protein